MVLRMLIGLGWTIVDLIAIAFSLVIIPALMFLLFVGSVCLLTGSMLALAGNGNGHAMMYGGGIILIATLILGCIIDYIYSHLR